MDLKGKIKFLAPDTAEKQKSNRKELYNDYRTFDGKSDRLAKLMKMHEHYFDKGFWCEYTPEELKEEIEKCLKSLKTS